MKAIICSKYGGPDVLKLQEMIKPVSKKNEICIQIHATAVTASDIFIRSSDLPLQYKIPIDFILDAVGKIKTSKLKQACRQALSPNGNYVSIDDGHLQLNSERLFQIKELIEIGAIKPVVDRCYRLEEIVEAHRYVNKGHKKGGVAISVQ